MEGEGSMEQLAPRSVIGRWWYSWGRSEQLTSGVCEGENFA